jgi:hypothetical protein
MTDTDRPSARFFILGKSGFARFQPYKIAVCGEDVLGEFHVRSASETKWVLAGAQSSSYVTEQLASGGLVEFSPASLMGSVPSPAKSHAARVNGSKGGRPRKS